MHRNFKFLAITLTLLASTAVHSQGAPPATQSWQGGFGGTYAADSRGPFNVPCSSTPLQGSGSTQTIESLEAQLMPSLQACLATLNGDLSALILSEAQTAGGPFPITDGGGNVLYEETIQPVVFGAYNPVTSQGTWQTFTSTLPDGTIEITASLQYTTGSLTATQEDDFKAVAPGRVDSVESQQYSSSVTFFNAFVVLDTCPGNTIYDPDRAQCVPNPAGIAYSLASPDDFAPNGIASCDGSVSEQGCAATAEPINPANGNESLVEPDDFRSADGKLRFTRTYNSLNSQSSVLGLRWLDNYASRQIGVFTPSVAPTGSVSNAYTGAQQACQQGWSDIAASQPNSTGVTATWNGSTCQLSNGQKLPVLSNLPHSNPAVDPNASYPVSILRPNGAQFWFFCQIGACNATPGVALQLAPQTGGGFSLINEDGSVESYTSSGQVQSVTTLGGYTQSFNYTNSQLSSVSDSFGRSLVFSYYANGLLSSISTPDGVTQYTYNSSNLLIAVTHPDLSTRQYQYNNSAFPMALTGVTDENGASYASISYDLAGRATQSSLANGVWQSSINYTNPSAPIVIDAFGVTRTYQYTIVFGQPKLASISGQSCNSCNAPATATYDASGYLFFTTDWNGNTTLHVNEPSGLEDAHIEAYGTPLQRTTFKQWNELFRLPTEIDESGRNSTFSYDSLGNLLSKTITDVNSGATRTTIYGGYTSFGQPLSVTGPRTDVAQVTQFSYYPIVAGDPKSGMLSQITDALGHVTTFNNYNASGHPIQTTDPNGLVTLMAYDARGRLVSTQAGTELTQYSYDGVGQLIETQLPNGAFLKYSYNAAHQLVGVQDQIGNRMVFSPDAMGNNVSEQIYNAAGTLVKTHSRLYNSFNQLIQDVGAQNQVTAYQNDNNGNRTRSTSPLGFQASSAYDALNRLSSIADPTNGITQYTYTALDQIAAVADPRTLVTTYLNDAFSDPLQVSSPDSGLTVKTFDGAGNVTTQTDNKGQATSFTYDALNRVTQIIRADQSTVTFSYDQGTNGIGHLTGMVDGSGSTNWSYDQHGRVTQKNSIVGSTTLSTLYGYDAAGRLVSMTMPSGKQVAYTWSNGQVVSLALTRKPNGASASLVSNVVYFPFGNPVSWTLGNGEVVSRVIDLDGRTTIDDVESIGYDSDSRVVTRALGGISALSDTQSFNYDAATRLTSYSDSSESISYQYDLSGNRIQEGTGQHQIAYTIDPTSNRILTSQKERVSGNPATALSTNVVPAIVIVGGPPPVTMSIAPTAIILSQQATLTWASPGADSCTASGNWSGTEQTSGDIVETPITAGTLTYTLTCSNSGGSTTSSVVLTVNAPAVGETIFNYDANGSLINDGVFNYAYDAANRLNQAEKIPAGTAAPTALSNYAANGLNQRVVMMTGTTAPVTTSLLSYDEAGHLVGHYANVAKVSDATETVWLGDMPVAIVKPANTFYVHTDYLNTPRQINNASQDPVWAWEPVAFGANAPNTDPTNSGTNFSYILRFPGQFADQEPGLRYNYARDYDPNIGRYVESDPIGVSGGINTYAYTKGNPISRIDQFGLSSLIYNPSTGTLTIVNGAGQIVGVFPAGNNAQSGSRGPLPPGDYSFAYSTTHPDDAVNSPFGSYGNQVFNVPGCIGCGVHSGRANSTDLAGRSGVNFATNGCIRTTDVATGLIRQLAGTGDPLSGLMVTSQFVPTNIPPFDPSLPGAPPVYLPDTNP